MKQFLRFFILWLPPFFSSCSAMSVEPLVDSPFADPVVVKRDGWWYITGTQNYYYYGKQLTRRGLKRKPLKLDVGKIKTAGDVWGISFYEHTDASWHGYGTLHLGYFRTVIAHFSPANPKAKWTPGNMIDHWVVDRVLIGDIAKNKTTMYDQKMYRTKKGLFLVYNDYLENGRIGILAQRMLDPATLDTNSPPICMLRPEGLRSEDRNNPGGLQITEGSTIHKINEKFILLYSVGDFALGNYKLGMAWSDTFIPEPGQTYKKIRRFDSSNVWENGKREDEIHYLLQSSKKKWPNYSGEWIKGPGIGGLVWEGNLVNLIFHGYPTTRGTMFEEGRMMFKLPCKVAVSNTVSPNEWIKPVFP